MSLKFDKVGHSTYVLYDDMCLGRITTRYDKKPYFQSFHEHPLSKGQLFDIILEMENMDVT